MIIHLKKPKKLSAWRWKGSATIESAFVLPICIFFIFALIRIGILVYDRYSFSLTVQRYLQKSEEGITVTALNRELEGALIFPQKAMIQKSNRRVTVSMKYAPLVHWRMTISLPELPKERLYHILNAKQLLPHVPILQEYEEKYFQKLEEWKRN